MTIETTPEDPNIYTETVVNPTPPKPKLPIYSVTAHDVAQEYSFNVGTAIHILMTSRTINDLVDAVGFLNKEIERERILRGSL